MRQLFMSVFILIVAIPCPTVAQTDKDDAVAIFQQAVAAYDAKNFVEAAALFREANLVRFNWKLLYNIGQCEAAAKRNGLALQAFEEYLTRAGDEITFERREEVLDEIQRLKLIVGMLEVDAPAGAIVLVDSEMRDRIPLAGPIMISSGITHDVTIIFDDEEILRQKVRVSGGNTQRIVARVKTPSSTTDAAPVGGATQAGDDDNGGKKDHHASPPSHRRLLGPILTGVGGAIIGAGLVCGVLAYKKGTHLDEKYQGDVPSGEADKVTQVDNLALTADILIPVGAATAISGFIIWMVQRKKTNRHRALVPAAMLTPNALGASLSGRF